MVLICQWSTARSDSIIQGYARSSTGGVPSVHEWANGIDQDLIDQSKLALQTSCKSLSCGTRTRTRAAAWDVGIQQPSPEALDTKECMLEVQGILLGKLGAEETYLKGVAGLPGFFSMDFYGRFKESWKYNTSA